MTSTVVFKPLPSSSLGMASIIINCWRKTFSKFYRRYSGLVEKHNVNLRKLLQQRISKPEFYGDLVYLIRQIVGKSSFAEQFRTLLTDIKG